MICWIKYIRNDDETIKTNIIITLQYLVLNNFRNYKQLPYLVNLMSPYLESPNKLVLFEATVLQD